MGKADILFFNTYNPVIPVLENLMPALHRRGIQAKAYISARDYRKKPSPGAAHYFQKARITYLSRPFKLLNHFLYGLAAIWKLIFSKADLYIFMSQPPLFIIPAAWIARVMNKKYAAHVMDMYPELLAASGVMNAHGYFYKMLSAGMRTALQKSEFIVVPGRCMKNKLEAYGINGDRIHVLTNPSSFTPKNPDSFVDKSPDDRFFVLYSGNMGVAHEFETILNVARELKQDRDLEFVFAGGGVRKREIENFKEKYNLPQLRFITYRNESEFQEWMQKANVHFISLKESFSGLLVPSKYYSALASGRPVIFEGPGDCEIALSIREGETGIHVMSGDAKSMTGAIHKLKADKYLWAKLGRNAREMHRNKESRENEAEAYLRILDR